MLSDQPDIAPFERAIQRLEEGLARYQSDTTDSLILDGVFQRFEYTYDLGHKILKHYLKYVSASPDVIDQMTFQDLIRTGNEQGLLLGEWTDWREYREMRAKTSHTYEENDSLEVVENIPNFIEDIAYLWDRLQNALCDQDGSTS